MLFHHKITCIFMIYVYLSRKFFIAIHALFPPIFLAWKVDSANVFTFRMYAQYTVNTAHRTTHTVHRTHQAAHYTAHCTKMHCKRSALHCSSSLWDVVHLAIALVWCTFPLHWHGSHCWQCTAALWMGRLKAINLHSSLRRELRSPSNWEGGSTGWLVLVLE